MLETHDNNNNNQNHNNNNNNNNNNNKMEQNVHLTIQFQSLVNAKKQNSQMLCIGKI